jgi:hypothetical protein
MLDSHARNHVPGAIRKSEKGRRTEDEKAVMFQEEENAGKKRRKEERERTVLFQEDKKVGKQRRK